MLRNSMIGLAAFGMTAAVAGYVWVALEFPFAIVLPAGIGWFAVTRSLFGARKAGWAALVGGVTFTGAFMVALFLALTDGSPFALTAWMSAVLAAALAGAATGWILDGGKGSVAMAGFSAAGMLVGTGIAGVMRTVAPAAVDVEGFAQSAYFALVLGVIGGVLGLAVGAGASWLASRRSGADQRS